MYRNKQTYIHIHHYNFVNTLAVLVMYFQKVLRARAPGAKRVSHKLNTPHSEYLRN